MVLKMCRDSLPRNTQSLETSGLKIQVLIRTDIEENTGGLRSLAITWSPTTTTRNFWCENKKKNEEMVKLMIMKMMIVFPIFFRFLINFDLPLGISRKIMLKWGHVRWRGIFQEVTTNSRTTRIERDLHIEVEWDDAFRKMPIHLWVVIFREFIQRQWGFRFWY